MGPLRPVLALGFAACVSRGGAVPAQEPPPPVTLTEATLPIYALGSRPSIRLEMHAPKATSYRPPIVGSRPVTVELAIANAGAQPVDLAGADLSFDVRRGPVRIPCASRNDMPARQTPHLMPGERTTLTRELCSLPLPGEYRVDAYLTLPGGSREHVGSFPLVVVAHGSGLPRAVAGAPGLFAAMGGDIAGIRYTREEWASGAYHVVVRLTNASTTPVHVGPGHVVFRVTKQGHPLACSSTHDVETPGSLGPGATWVAQVPVTCVINAKGKYDIHAALALEREETPLGDLSVEVTTSPSIYFIIPW